MTTFLFVLTIFATIWSSIIVVGRAFLKQNVYALNILLFAASWTALITHWIGLWG